jgi:hypothetical protein
MFASYLTSSRVYELTPSSRNDSRLKRQWHTPISHRYGKQQPQTTPQLLRVESLPAKHPGISLYLFSKTLWLNSYATRHSSRPYIWQTRTRVNNTTGRPRLARYETGESRVGSEVFWSYAQWDQIGCRHGEQGKNYSSEEHSSPYVHFPLAFFGRG